MEETTIGNARILHGDCLTFMRELPDKFYDLAIVDPPYGIGFSSKEQSNFGKCGIKHQYKNWDIVPTNDYWEQLFRVSKNQIVWGANYFTKYLPISRCWLSWYKMQEFSTNEFELAWTSFDATSKQFNLSRVQAYANQNKIHPTQKPISLYEFCFTNYAKQGDKIFDSHGGSMSSVIAALNLGFEITCLELDDDYYKSGVARVRQSQQQVRMFEPEVIVPKQASML